MRAEVNQLVSVCNSSAAVICVRVSRNFKSFPSNDSSWKSLQNDKTLPTWGFSQGRNGFGKLQGGTAVKGRMSWRFGSGGQEPQTLITCTPIADAYKRLMSQIQRDKHATNWRKSLFPSFHQVAYEEDAVGDSVFRFPYTVDACVWAFALARPRVLFWRSYGASKSVQKRKSRSKFEVKICQTLQQVYKRL